MSEETDTPIAESTEEQSVDVNREAAAEQSGAGAELAECPTCHNMRRQFLIVEGKCDSCRTKGQPAQIVPELGWPEVRARRDRMISSTDWTQLTDVNEETSSKYAPLRQRLRDVTEKPDPFEAWYELDAIDVEIAK